MTACISEQTWQKNLSYFINVKSFFILKGNTSDIYPVSLGGGTEYLDIVSAVRHLFGEDSYRFLTCDPVNGFSSSRNSESDLSAVEYYRNLAAQNSARRRRLYENTQPDYQESVKTLTSTSSTKP